MRLHEVPRLQVQAAKCLVLKLPVNFLNVIVALPVPFQDRFIKNDSFFRVGKSDETGSKSDPPNSSKSSPILKKGSLRIRIEIRSDF